MNEKQLRGYIRQMLAEAASDDESTDTQEKAKKKKGQGRRRDKVADGEMRSILEEKNFIQSFNF